MSTTDDETAGAAKICDGIACACAMLPTAIAAAKQTALTFIMLDSLSGLRDAPIIEQQITGL